MDLIDSHCHLKLFHDEGVLPDVLGRATRAGVKHMLAVGTSPDDWVPHREMHARYPEQVDYTVGLHPCYVDEDLDEILSQISAFFMPPNAPVAIGEFGLDFFHLPQNSAAAIRAISLQKEAMSQQLLLAREFDCPIIIHSRDCFKECVRLIDESDVDWSRIVFHCFSYGPAEMQALNERGARASFTGIVTYKSAQTVREALQTQGVERLMLETDCPYLSPEPHRGKQNEPAHLKHIAECCAEVLGMSSEALATQTSANTKAFFKLQ